MNEPDPFFALLRDSRLAPYAVSPGAAWLWSADGSRIHFANAVGAAVFGAASPAALLARRFSSTDPLAKQIARLAETLPHAGAARLERFRHIGDGIGRPLACACSRLALPDFGPALLMVAAEPLGPRLSLAERAQRLFAAADAPVAIFAVDGSLVHATPAAAERLHGRTTLGEIGADAPAAEALGGGHAAGETAAGMLDITRVGSGSDTVLIVTFAGPREPREIETAAGGHVRASPETADPGTRRAVATAPFRAPGRRHPLRFVWQMDVDGRFTVGSDEFADVMGPRTAAMIGHPWQEIAATLGIDPAGRVATAVESRETWSGITLAWPLDVTDERVTVELSGLPIFDRDRTFRGYRGFGVCRDVTRPAPEDAVLSAAPSSPSDTRPHLSVVPAAKNVVPFRTAGAPATDKRPALTSVESTAFREIGKVLGPPPEGEEIGHAARAAPTGIGAGQASETALRPPAITERGPALAPAARVMHHEPCAVAIPSAYAPGVEPAEAIEPVPPAARDAEAMIDRLPVVVLVYRASRLIYVNRTLLEWTGYGDLDAIAAAGGLEALFVEQGLSALEAGEAGGKTLAIATRAGDEIAVDGRLFAVPWDGESALMLLLARVAAGKPRISSDIAPSAAEAEIRELRSILDTATDGVVVVERDGRIVALNRSAEALFGHDSRDLHGHPFVDLFAPESHRAALDTLDGLSLDQATSLTNHGREVIGRVRQGGAIPLFMTMGRIGEDGGKFCAVFRDMTQWKRAAEQLLEAKRLAEKASQAKSDYLAKISHEIRTPLNAIIGFSEVMMEERFGPISNERYRAYLKDIHASGEHLLSLINDLLDLSKIEAGKLDLVFTKVDLNGLTQQCVALMQPEANRERIIIRTSLSPTVPAVMVDARSIRQIVLNLLSNAIKFTGAGGQVIVSTALSDRGDVVMRVRDTGAGMSEKDIVTALEPFRQLATSGRWGSGGTGLGLPLTKALAEANRATFTIKSAVNAGTLVEITFPPARELAEQGPLPAM